MLNFSEIDEKKFGEHADTVILPIITFLLNVTGNSLAIVCLLKYKIRSKSRTSVDGTRYTACSITDATLNLNGTGENKLDGRSKKRKRSVKFGVFHTLVSVLAVLDLLGTVCTTPVTIILYTNHVHIEVFGGKPLCHYSAFTMLFFGFTSMAMVMCMSIERLFSIRYAFLYHRKATSRKALLLVFGMFAASAIFCSLPIFGFGTVRAMYPNSWCFANWNTTINKHKVFNYLYVSLGIAMFVVTVFCNGVVISGLLHMKAKVNSHRKSRTMSRETQMIIQVLVMTCIFAICWLPLMFRILVNQLGLLKSSQSDRAALYLAIVNPILDPWVYILCRMSVFRRIHTHVKNFLCTRTIQSSCNLPKTEQNSSGFELVSGNTKSLTTVNDLTTSETNHLAS